MAQYRHDLPQMTGESFLTDGGLETTLVFLDGIDLPHFASFPLLDSVEGRAALTRYYESYLAIAAQHGIGFVLDSPTWRANPDWGALLGYSPDDVRRVNSDSIRYLDWLRAKWRERLPAIVLNGVIGPRGDGYKDGRMEAGEAEEYHRLQVETFADGEADMVSAITMNNIGEAVGIARAARAANMPCVISFTVETDGKLVGGASLREAVETVDAATDGSPAYYMVNCAHPLHFDGALARGEDWVARVQGIRANASTKSHAELDESTELDIGDPVDLGRRYAGLRREHRSLRVFGGCCGTDNRHLAAICAACFPVVA